MIGMHRPKPILVVTQTSTDRLNDALTKFSQTQPPKIIWTTVNGKRIPQLNFAAILGTTK